jgi:TonB family protein
MDSASLVVELEGWLPAAGLTVASIYPDSTGAPEAHVFSESLDEAGRDRLEDLLERHLRVPPERYDDLVMEVGTSSGLAPRRLERIARCVPVLQNTRDIQRAIARDVPRMDIDGSARVVVAMRVEPDGTVSETRIQEGSGSPAVDQAMLEVMRSAMFSPGRIEGILLSLWVEIPLNVNVIERDPFPPPVDPPPPRGPYSPRTPPN